MKRIKLWILLMMIFILVGGSLIYNQQSAKNEGETYTVQFPEFTIKINGDSFTETYNLESAMFPLILYHDRIYYPLTAESKKLLNLQDVESSDTDEICLQRADEELIKEYIPETIAPPHPEYFKRVMVASPCKKTLKVNDVIITTKDMEHPLLEYMRVEYMPLTPDLVIEQLEGSYFLNEDGLEILTGDFH
jgi:hypothetical protein